MCLGCVELVVLCCLTKQYVVCVTEYNSPCLAETSMYEDTPHT